MNEISIHYLNLVLGGGAILLQIFSVITILVLFFGPSKSKFLDYVEKHSIIMSFLVSFLSSIFSLVYSEIIGFPPCVQCWYQRVFLFPQVFILGVALWEREKKVIKYAMPLLLSGFVVSIYQNFKYYFGETSSLPCDASGVSCYQHLISEYGGYISIPMLALTGFFCIIVILTVAHFYNKRNNATV